MTAKYPLSLHFRAVSRTTTGPRSMFDCSTSKGLQSCNNHITYIIVIEEMTWFRKVVSTMISNLICLHNWSSMHYFNISHLGATINITVLLFCLFYVYKPLLYRTIHVTCFYCDLIMKLLTNNT